MRPVHDRRVGRAGLDRGESGARASHRHEARLNRVPQAFLLEVLLRVDADRHRGGVADGDPLDLRIGDLLDVLERVRSIVRQRHGEQVAQHIKARSVLHQAGGGDDVHLRFVGADEDIHRRAVDDLPRQDVRRGEVEPHMAARAAVGLGNGRQGFRQADGGRNGDGLGGRHALTGRNPRREIERQQCVDHAASLIR